MTTLRSVAIAALVAAGASQASLAQVSGQVKWQGVGQSFGSEFRQPYRNVYAGSAYRASFLIASQPAGVYLPPAGTSTFGPVVDIYCVDFLNTAKTGSSGYNAWFTNLSDDTPLTVTRSSDRTKYLQTAWLIQQMDGYKQPDGSYSAADKAARKDIHAAIWQIMSGSPTEVRQSGVWTSTGVTSWVNQAQAGWDDGSVNAAEWTVVTDACVSSTGRAGAGFSADNCGQEFLTRQAVPEPGTLILLGTGLLGLLVMSGALRRPLG